jgi:hypothetical protein
MNTLHFIGATGACLVIHNSCKERQYRARVDEYLKVHSDIGSWCQELDRSWKRAWNLQNVIGRRQAILEERLKKLGFVRWSDFDEEEEDGVAEMWLGNDMEEAEAELEQSDDAKRASELGDIENKTLEMTHEIGLD